MKILFATALLFGLAQAGYAQTAIKAGTVQVGGGINYSHYSNATNATNSSGNRTVTESTSNQLSINPYGGYFVADNLVVGLNLGYTAANRTLTYTPTYPTNFDNSTSRQYTIGPYVQYYQMLTDQFGLTGMLGAGYEHDSQPTTTSNNTIFYGSKVNGFYSGLTPGVVFFPIPKFSIGASIGGLTYSRLSQRSDQPSTGDNYENVLSNFGANFGLSQLLFSGTYYFGR